jgi:hypothetical protein
MDGVIEVALPLVKASYSLALLRRLTSVALDLWISALMG